MNKKAQDQYGLSVFNKYVLAILFLIFGIVLIGKLFGGFFFESKTTDAACFYSVLRNHEERIPGVYVEQVKINCPTKYITFFPGGYEEEFEVVDRGFLSFKKQNTEENKQVYDCSGTDDQEECMFYNINKKIASEMARCWNDFHEGKLRVFSLYETDKQCVICSSITFDNEIVKKYGDEGMISMLGPENPFYDLDWYMRHQNYDPFDITYYEYTLDTLDKNWEYPYYSYDVSNDYSIVFIALNKHHLKNVLEGAWESVKTELLGADEKDEEGNFINTLELIPNDEVGIYCDTWA